MVHVLDYLQNRKKQYILSQVLSIIVFGIIALNIGSLYYNLLLQVMDLDWFKNLLVVTRIFIIVLLTVLIFSMCVLMITKYLQHFMEVIQRTFRTKKHHSTN
jgi:H+/Cl- antiporter ClcA